MAVMNRVSVALVLLVVSFLCGASMTRGAVYKVGDEQGWRVGVNYTKWASDKHFVVNDTLVFTYDPSKISRLTIVQVGWLEYERCNLMESLGYYKSGNDSVHLTTSGDFFFMTLNTAHCFEGVKLHVFVHNSTSPATPSPSPSPTTPSISSPSPSPSQAPTSSGPSPTPSQAPTSSGPSPSPSQAPTSSGPSPSSTGSGPMSPPPSSTVTAPSPYPDESPADDSTPAKSGGVVLRCSEVVGLVLALAVAVMC